MTCREICEHSLSGHIVSMPADQKLDLLNSLSGDSSALTSICVSVLEGSSEQEPSLKDAALRLDVTLRAIRTVTKNSSCDTRFIASVAKGVEEALTKICGLAPLILQADKELACLDPVLMVGESLNSLYCEVGYAISQ